MNSKAIRKQLFAAVAMVLVAAVALGSSTYAWFAAQNDVTATGMSVKAQGESGIVIRHEQYQMVEGKNTLVATDWMTTADAGMTGDPVALKPTSTVNLADWYHNKSDEMDDAKKEQGWGTYEQLSANLDQYYLKTQFAIRSAQAGVPLTGKDLAVKSLNVDKATNTSPNLDQALRVGVQIGSDFYIYAPLASTDSVTLIANYTKTSDSAEATSITEYKQASQARDTFDLSDNTIPAGDDTAIKAYVYMWFEGEDPECKSSNITETLDELKLTVVFTTIDPV